MSIEDIIAPLPLVGTEIEVLWSNDLDWWRAGRVVSWNGRRHEVLYHDEPDEEPVEERFWGRGNVARYRLVGMFPLCLPD